MLVRVQISLLLLLLPAIFAASGLAVNVAPPASAVAFSNWMDANAGKGQPIRVSAQGLQNGLSLARERATAMRKLMEANPAEFVRQAMPEKERGRLPAELQAVVEQRIRARGSFSLVCELPTSDEPHHHGGFKREVRVGGQTYQAFVFGNWTEQTTVEEAWIEGVALEDAMALGDAPTPAEQLAAGEVVIMLAPSKTGPNTLLYYNARFSGETNDPITDATATNRMATVSQFWLNNSSNTVSICGLVNSNAVMDIVHITLPSDGGTYTNNFSLLLSDARAAAKTLGYTNTNYNLDVVVTSNPGFTYAGKANVGSMGTHLRFDYTTLRTAGHELGHNLGLYHANYWRTDATMPFGRDSVPGGYVSDSTDDEWIEYGHYFSIMSAQTGTTTMDDPTKPHYTATEKVKLGWLAGAAVQYVSTNGTYRLFRHDHRDTTGTPRGIRIERTATDYTGNARRYWLNYRYVDFSTASRDWLRNGLQIDVARTTYTSDGATQLDMTPYSKDVATYMTQTNLPSSYWTVDNNDKLDGMLLVGRTYSDTAAGIHITPIATSSNIVNEEYIDVVINLGTFTTNHPPIITNFTASATQVATNQSVNFTVAATDPDGDPLAYSWNFDQVQTFTASGLNSNAATKSWSTNGQYRVTVTVSDMKGGIATESLIVTVGSPTNTRQIWGRAIWGGVPVYNARVCGITGSTTNQVWTDSNGSYVLTDLASASNYTVNCARDGLTFTPQFTNPVTVAAANAYGKDFYADQLGTAGTNTLAISPFEIAINAGDTVNFNADAWDSAGNPMTVTPDWSATGGGVISTAGVFTATYAGTYNILATVGSLTATATVWITGGTAPIVTITATDASASETGSDTGAVRLTRTGSTAAPMDVKLGFSGTASNGLDYTTIPNTVTILAGNSNLVVTLTPLADSLAEGDETAVLSVLPYSAYAAGSSSNATITIHDAPYDNWRYTKFTAAELLDPAISGNSADPDGDGLGNLLEYAFGLEPRVVNTTGRPTMSQQTGYLCLTYRESMAATDVTYAVQACSNLFTGDWSSTGLAQLSKVNKTTYWEVTVRDAVLMTNAPQRFMRVKVTAP